MERNEDLEQIRRELREQVRGCVRTGSIRLSSGGTTDFYIDGRLVTLDPIGLARISALAFDMLAGKVDAVGGPTSGADPIVAGIGQRSLQFGPPLKTFFTRSQNKDHGRGKRLEGPALAESDRVAIVDDTATTGRSLVESARIVMEDTPARPVLAWAIVDREEGAREALAEAGLELLTLFTRSEIQAPD